MYSTQDDRNAANLALRDAIQSLPVSEEVRAELLGKAAKALSHSHSFACGQAREDERRTAVPDQEAAHCAYAETFHSSILPALHLAQEAIGGDTRRIRTLLEKLDSVTDGNPGEVLLAALWLLLYDVARQSAHPAKTPISIQ